MKIILDAFGGDFSPKAHVSAALKAADALDCEIILVGDEKILNNCLSSHSHTDDRVHIAHAAEVILNSESPAKAVHEKKNSSIVVAAGLLKEGAGDALVSSGSTGAILTAALTKVGRIKGVRRPALATVLPSQSGGTLLLDCGANTDCKSEDLYNFAVMGNIFMKRVIGLDNPRVALLSNGEEEGKGNQTVKEAFGLLHDADLNFIGNCEGRDIMLGGADVVACDGFVGNVALKSIEGAAKLITVSIREMFMSNLKTKLGAALVSSELGGFKKKFDYREYGGAPLLGINAPIIKAHGASDDKSLLAAMLQAKSWITENVNGEIEKCMNKL